MCYFEEVIWSALCSERLGRLVSSRFGIGWWWCGGCKTCTASIIGRRVKLCNTHCPVQTNAHSPSRSHSPPQVGATSKTISEPLWRIFEPEKILMQPHRHTHVTKFEAIGSLTLTVDQISADFVQDLFVQPQAVNGIPQNCPVGQVLGPICVLLQCKQKSSNLSSVLLLETKCCNSKCTCVTKSMKHMVDTQEFKDIYWNERWKYFLIYLRVKARLMKPWNCIARGSRFISFVRIQAELYKHTRFFGHKEVKWLRQKRAEPRVVRRKSQSPLQTLFLQEPPPLLLHYYTATAPPLILLPSEFLWLLIIPNPSVTTLIHSHISHRNCIRMLLLSCWPIWPYQGGFIQELDTIKLFAQTAGRKWGLCGEEEESVEMDSRPRFRSVSYLNKLAPHPACWPDDHFWCDGDKHWH